MILTLYIFLPLRQQDYLNLHEAMNRVSDEVNYIDIANKVIVINNYKTVNNHGQRIINLDEETTNILSKYYYESRDGKPLLPPKTLAHY